MKSHGSSRLSIRVVGEVVNKIFNISLDFDGWIEAYICHRRSRVVTSIAQSLEEHAFKHSLFAPLACGRRFNVIHYHELITIMNLTIFEKKKKIF